MKKVKGKKRVLRSPGFSSRTILRSKLKSVVFSRSLRFSIKFTILFLFFSLHFFIALSLSLFLTFSLFCTSNTSMTQVLILISRLVRPPPCSLVIYHQIVGIYIYIYFRIYVYINLCTHEKRHVKVSFRKIHFFDQIIFFFAAISVEKIEEKAFK